MMLNGKNVAAFKLPIEAHPGIVSDCRWCVPMMTRHNMQVSGSDWRGVALRAPLNRFTMNDPAAYRKFLNPGETRDDRLEYQRQWGWTEVAAHCSATTGWLADHMDLGQFMGLTKFMEVIGHGKIRFHSDNVPGKEFRIAVGLEGIENEVFLMNAGKGIQKLQMKPLEVWFIDIAMAHAVFNKSDQPRYRLGAQFYGPPTDRLMDMFYRSEEIIYAADYDYEPPFVDHPA